LARVAAGAFGFLIFNHTFDGPDLYGTGKMPLPSSPASAAVTGPSIGACSRTEREGRFVETFKVDSWIEHLRQHERVTHADREVQESVNRFEINGAPKVTHLIACA
jgi:hypothetical protein